MSVMGNGNAGDRVRQSALRLFASKGFQATGIREIADGAGISSAALYHYMGTKEDLLVAIMEHALSSWYSTAADAVATGSGPSERLSNFVRSHVICSAVFQLESTVVDTEIRALTGDYRTRVVRLRDQYEELFDEILQDGVGASVFVVTDVRTTRLALLEMCNGVSRWFSLKGPKTIERLAEDFADIALAAVQARKGRRRVSAADLDVCSAGAIVDNARRNFAVSLATRGRKSQEAA
jgi:AcrR family transcriptional regulator